MKLTKRAIDDLVAGPSDRFVWDDTLSGFGLKITPRGKKVFVLQTRLKGRSRRFTIGQYGSPWAPDQARNEALRLMTMVAEGRDPLAEEKRAQHDDTNVLQLCDWYFRDGCKHKKQLTIDNERGLSRRHIQPLLGEKHVRSLTKAILQKFLNDVQAGKSALVEKTKKRGKAVVTGGPGSANRTFALLASMLTFAVENGVRLDNPATGIKLFKLRKRDRYLRNDELEKVGTALAKSEAAGVNPVALNAIRFLLLSGCRKNEALGLQWKWIDFERNLIALPDSKTGARYMHLGSAARALLLSLPKIQGSPYVFPSSRGTGPFVGLRKIWDEVRKAADIEDVRLHDLRHSFASSAVSSGQSLYIVGKLLGHTQAQTTQRYAHLALDPVKMAADLVSTEIADKLAGKAKKAADADDQNTTSPTE